jgi:catechol 2,3-dioxygenase-like lactoylglutathione lyase family enzyme
MEAESMPARTSRRTFVRTMAAAGAAVGGMSVAAQESGRVAGFDHVALPMQNVEAMLAFYRGLGFAMNETPNVVSVYVGSQMINFHRPTLWQNATFTLRAPAAKPPCGDLCFVWEGSAAALSSLLARLPAKIEVGPVERQGGRRKGGSSVYVRDPDGNLLEFIIYA